MVVIYSLTPPRCTHGGHLDSLIKRRLPHRQSIQTARPPDSSNPRRSRLTTKVWRQRMGELAPEVRLALVSAKAWSARPEETAKNRQQPDPLSVHDAYATFRSRRRAPRGLQGSGRGTVGLACTAPAMGVAWGSVSVPERVGDVADRFVVANGVRFG